VGPSSSHIHADIGKVSLEGSAVIWRGDHDRPVAVLDRGEKILTHLFGEFLLVPVKQRITWSRRPKSRTSVPIATASPVQARSQFD